MSLTLYDIQCIMCRYLEKHSHISKPRVKEPNFFYAPLWLFDVIIDSLQWVSDTFNSEKFENAAELGRIGKYYAV